MFGVPEPAPPIVTTPAMRGPGGAGTEPSQRCPTCRAMVPLTHRFCFNCGGRMPEYQEPESTQIKSYALPMDPSTATSAKVGRSTMLFGAMQAARAKLTLIRGDGLDGISYTLAGDEHLAGRIDCPLLFADDPFVSPIHANFFYRDAQLVVRDEGSTNSVYLRINGTVPLPFGTRFLIGEQVLELQRAPDLSDAAQSDGTYFYASPKRAVTFRIEQLLRGGDIGQAIHAGNSSLVLGREGNDLDFLEDPFISGRHAKIEVEPQGGDVGITLTDLGSRNGTFVRIAGEQVLRHGDYVFMGQQLLRVEIV